MRFSIIIPVFNVASYLRTCLDSIREQSFCDWECVCVNDGSTDGSGEVLEQYAREDSRYKVLHQKNSGVSAARNLAMGKMRGDYALFVDGDDVVHPKMLERLIDAMGGGDVDAVVFGLKPFPDGTACAWDGLMGGRRCVVNLENDMRGAPTYNFTCCAYSRRITQGLEFGAQTVGEDVLFLQRAMLRANKIAKIPDALYGYRTRSGSAIQSKISVRKLIDRIDVARELLLEYGKTSRRIPADWVRMECNALMESVPYDWLSVVGTDRRTVKEVWEKALVNLDGLELIPARSRCRMRLVLWMPFLTMALCQLPHWLKVKGVHR